MAQIGHTTSRLTPAIYARPMDCHHDEAERLKALVDGGDWTAANHSRGRVAGSPYAALR